jgi:hypothetical protein
LQLTPSTTPTLVSTKSFRQVRKKARYVETRMEAWLMALNANCPQRLSLNPFLNPPFVESGWVAQVSFLRPGFFCRTDLAAETQSRKARYQTVESFRFC